MKTNIKTTEISDSMRLLRFQDGVKLVKTDKNNSELGYDTGYTVNSLLTLPFNVGVCNLENQIVYANCEASHSLGFNSNEKLIGQRGKNLYTAETLSNLKLHCESVLSQQSTQMIEEELILKKDGSKIQRLSIRAPWYDEKNRIIGIFNTSITLGKHVLSRALNHIKNITLLKTPKFIIQNKENISLTEREKQVAYHLIRGKTAKLIAEALFISPRTVEVHLENLKGKFGVHSKTVLIEKLLSQMQN